jgi:hypothetical protein
LKGEIKEFFWISENVAILRTDEDVYVTSDGGRSYTEQNTLLCKELKCIIGLYVSPLDSNFVILIGRNGDNYVATNMKSYKRGSANANYKKFTMPLSGKEHPVKKLLFHPNYKNYALALVNIDVTGQRKLHNLYVTKNGAQSWTLIKENIRDSLWFNTKAEGYDDDKLFAVRSIPANGFNSLFTYDIVTDRLSNEVIGAHDIFHLDKFTFMASKTGSESKLHVSTDNGQQFRAVQLPDKKGHQKAYVLLDSSGGSVFLNVFESSTDAPVSYGTVYQSDWSGSRYSTSLVSNRGVAPSVRHRGAADFHKIVSMEGVYIANVYANLEDEICKECADMDCRQVCHVTTAITFDKGGIWQPIEAPTRDSRNIKVSCRENDRLASGRCPLNLHGFATINTTPIHSHQKAAGLVLATGNTGPYLHSHLVGAEVNTYMSRDAGLSWFEIAKGSHTYEITDNGGLLVLAKTESANEIHYSLDQGLSWEAANFTSKNNHIAVQRIHHHKDVPAAKSVAIQGRNEYGTVLIFADFSKIDWPICKGYENPDQDNSDYETFTPHTYKNNRCLLGRSVEYVRRKKASKCYIPEEAVESQSTIIKNCECTHEDFECDFYYVRKDGQCIPKNTPEAQEQIENFKLPPRRCYGTYNETKGYRKLAGNSCQGGVDLNPVVKPCPSTISFLGVMILLLFLGILFSFTGVFLYRNSPAIQELLNPSRRPSRSSPGVAYNTISQNESDIFGLDDEEDEDEPDEFDETHFRVPARSPVNSEFKTQHLDQSNTRTVSLDQSNHLE